MKFMFNPKYVKADLRRIITYTKNKIGCKFENIHVITDLIPDEELCREIKQEFSNEVNKFLKIFGVTHDIKYTYNQKPLEWLALVCQNIASKYPDRKKEREKYLYKKVSTKIIPIVSNNNIIEFVSLFTNIIQIKGSYHYGKILEKIFYTLSYKDNLFFYYTGHGVRFLDFYQYDRYRVKDIKLVIPSYNSSSEFYSRRTLCQNFKCLSDNISCFVIIDCCHAENLLGLPITIDPDGNLRRSIHKESIKYNADIVYLGSTYLGQTCGFYINSVNSGSLFTHHLINELEKLIMSNRDISSFHNTIERKILEYRTNTGKTPQNTTISFSHNIKEQLPKWLFRNHSNQFNINNKK